MSNYTQSTNFATKDALSLGNPLKIVRGTEINTEFTNIAVAVATKLDNTALAAPGPIGATTPAAINGTTGTFSGAVSGTTGTFSSAVSGTTGTFSSAVSGTTGTFSSAVSGTTGTFSSAVSGSTGIFSSAVSGSTGIFSGAVSGSTGTFSSAVSGSTGTFSGNVQMASANGGQLAGLRNKIINGNMSVAQYGTTAVNLTTANQFLADRFSAQTAGTTPPTVSLGYSTDASVSVSSGRHIFLSTTVAKATLDPSNVTFFTHSIEGYNVADLLYGTASAKTVTISFRARLQNLASAVIAVAFRNSAQNRAYVANVTVTGAAATYSVTIPGDTTGTWLTDNGVGIRVTFCIGSGSTSSTSTVNAWHAGNFVATSTTTNVTGTATAAFSISDVQLEVGPVATPFEQRPIGMELALCQRYFEVTSYSMLVGTGFSGNNTGGTCYWKVDKRTVPTVTQVANNIYFTQTNVGSTSTYLLASQTNAVTIFRAATASANIQFSETLSAFAEL